MKQLKVVSFKGQLVTESRDVAKMIDKPHNDLMKSIRIYMNYLGLGEIPHSDFFIESTYKNSQNKTQPCYLLTRKGCDMVANKMTGKKGVLFTAEYVTRFEEMENELKQKTPTTTLEVLQGTINQMVEQEQKINKLEGKVNNISNLVTLTSDEWREKVTVIIKKIARNWTGVDPYRSVINLSYERLEKRAGCNLKVRLNNRKERAAAQGMPKSYVQKINKLDCISEEKRLVEIYLQVVKEMAIQFKVNINNFEEVI